MPVNPSNSNPVNLRNLPQAQLISPGDYLIVETPEGTEIIDFANLNVVKTDINGNATVLGSLTGQNFFIVSAIANSVSALAFSSNGAQGVTQTGFFNLFTLNGGIVTSAVEAIGSPEFEYITRTFIPNVTAYQTVTYSALTAGLLQIVDLNGVATITPSTSSTQVIINNFFNNYPISLNNIQPAHFTVSVPVNGSFSPYVTGIQNISQNLSFVINPGNSFFNSNVAYWRLLLTY